MRKMFVLMILFYYFVLILGVGAAIVLFFGRRFGLFDVGISVALASLCSFGYLYYRAHEKTVLGDWIETLLMVLMGVLVVAISVVFIFWCVEWILPKTISLRGGIGGSLLLLVIVGVSIYAWRAAHAIQVKNLTIPVENLKSPSKMIYLSDIHIAKKSDLPFLQEIVDTIKGIDADFVVINGDFVDGKGFDDGDFQMLDQIDKPILFTYGNHEAYVGNDYAYSLLASTKLQILADEKIELAGWEILGLSDIHAFDNQSGRDILRERLEQHPYQTDKPKMLILHEPIGPELAEEYGVNFQVAGHTHYGQLFPFTLFVKIAFPYIKGWYPFKTSSLFVSSGVGTWGPPMRLGSRSEILVFEFVPKK